MTVHYKSKKNNRYPKTACGIYNISHRFSDVIENVTCLNCRKSLASVTNDLLHNSREERILRKQKNLYS
jgi:hypothetical protein